LSIFDSLFGSGNTTTTSQQQSLSGPAAGVATDLFSRAQQYANQPYSQYWGPRTAEFTPDQIQAFDNTRNISGTGAGLFNTLSGRVTGDMAGREDALMRTLGGNVAGAAGASTDLLSSPVAQTFNNVDLSGYMNPYVDAVLNPAIDDLVKQADLRRNQLQANSVRTGSFGGSRNALALAENSRNTEQEVGRLSANERARAFNEAAQQFRNDQTALPGLFNAIAQTNLAGQQAATNTGAYQQQGYQNLTNLLGANQGRFGTEVNPLLATGGLQQAQQQGIYDLAAQDFNNQRDWGARGIQALQGALGVGGGATGASSTTTQTQPEPNRIGQVLGAGTGLIGALGGLGGVAGGLGSLWNTASDWFSGPSSSAAGLFSGSGGIDSLLGWA
jgi:hypothetical protein